LGEGAKNADNKRTGDNESFDFHRRFGDDHTFFLGIAMLLHLTDLSDEPLQGQIVRQIRAKVLAGEMIAETDLPSIRRLARENHISVITVQRAYETLEREGLIHSRRGKGFFVTHLSDDKRKKLARNRLQEILSPGIKDALNEGLDKDEIKKVISAILEEN
jgi:GntR family transcriptional regulator